MRLSQIRLCGFKSFVDPTVLLFPGNRVGVVGPNGCGKSNVIDAVRWVMGESSAKTLRGAAMADVIFNGSAHRKPADFAEVELVFGEAELEQFPGMGEIGIKRKLTKDGKSSYYLNGVVCRRKDITEIFLGTGLGPRSYSIIEQGMISRFIEAKPEELRIFLEEAAGISRYKERRRETELRIEHTRENMQRLSDVRLELDKQLEKLRRQAKAAERYQQIKEAERVLKGQLLAMRWKGFNDEIEKQEYLMKNHQDMFQQLAAAFAEVDAALHQHRAELPPTNARLNAAQEQFYSHQNELDRIEQNLAHSREWRDQLDVGLAEAQHALAQARAELADDGAQAEALTEELAAAEYTLEESGERLESLQYALEQSQQQAQARQTEWETFQRRLAEPEQRIQVEQTRAQNLEQRLAHNRARLQRLNEENSGLDVDAMQGTLEALQLQAVEAEEAVENLRMELETCRQGLRDATETIDRLNRALHEKQATQRQIQGRLAALEALQESALGKGDNDVASWLRQRGFDENTPRLAQVLRVEPGWERAVETVLGQRVEALCLNDLNDLISRMDALPQGRVMAMDTRQAINAPLPDALSAKAHCPWPIASLLSGVFTAETPGQAYTRRAHLAAHESVITPQGLWLGHNWLIINEDIDERAGVFAREQDMRQLRDQADALERALAELQEQLAQSKDMARIHEQRQGLVEAQLRNSQQAHMRLQTERSAQQARTEQLSSRARHILAEHRELTQQVQADEEALQLALAAIDDAHLALEEMQAQTQELDQSREQLRRNVEQQRRQWELARDQHHQITSRQQAARAEQARVLQNVSRLHDRVAQLEEKQYELQNELDRQQPLDEWESQRDEFSIQRETLELAVNEAREQVAHLNETIRAEEHQLKDLENQLQSFRSLLEDARLGHQGNLVRRQTVEEQLAEQEYQIEGVLATLPAEATIGAWEEGLADLEKKAAKLGSINLAALEECQEQAERKRYLDEQYADLEQAMASLEQAIASIDAETRTRLLQTLNQVNSNFQRLFPTLFGGGEASLAPTSEDLLSAGIQIMARPLGKRNSTIHLLSGGEKALTAVALVFSIFELNPAPFCLLDEVDAPLDDTNVSRFSNLVRKMAETVQFIFITHNKVAMEMAEQLIGVTMSEPGVSRPVAVDIDLAVAMAEG